nr:hypothetical protein [Tanacetum cinerariifolium]
MLFNGCANQDLCTTLTIDFTEAVDPTIYGKLKKDAEGASEKKHKPEDKYDICARTAFQALLMQQRILAFLLACTRAILHD